MVKTIAKSHNSFKSSIYQKIWDSQKLIPFLPSDNEYNITISNEHKFIWFQVPKVGYSTVRHILDVNKIKLTAEEAFQVYYPPKYYNEFFKFAFVRNPWDRLVSGWKDKVVNLNLFNFSESELEKMKNLPNFIEFLANQDLRNFDPHFKLQSKLIDLNNVDFIGRFENFTPDLAFILNTIKIENPEIPILNKSNREFEGYKTYFNETTAQTVAKIYEKDIRTFGYKF
jgi:hypothetical protein